MLLPGESSGTPILNDYALEAANSVAAMQLWGLENQNLVSGLLRNKFLMWNLAEKEMLHRGRLREQDIKAYVERRFKSCPRELEFKLVTADSEWVLRILRRRGRIIQPFRFYFLCWILGATLDDLQNFEPPAKYQGESFSPRTKPRKILASQKDISIYRLEFTCDRNINFHDKSGYYWAVAGAECNTVIELKPEHHAALPWSFA